MRNNVWQQNEINVLKFLIIICFDLNWLKSMFVPLPIKGYMTVKQNYSFLALIWFITIKLHVVKVFIFAVFRHNS